jgi:hypothetical protein
MRALGTRLAGSLFAELICADEQWLHEEFDALIAASYGPPPVPPRPAPPRTPPSRRPRPSASAREPVLTGSRLPARRGSAGGHQRSPP